MDRVEGAVEQSLVSRLSSLSLPLQVPIEKVNHLPVVQIKVLRRSVGATVSGAWDNPELVFAGEFRQDRLAHPDGCSLVVFTDNQKG